MEELPAPGFDAFSGVGAVAAPLRIVSRRERPTTEPPRSDDERKEARADAHARDETVVGRLQIID